MRIALMSPYSWSYPGGVARHVEALADQHLAAGHDVRVLAPVDPDDRRARRSHGGVRPQARELPDYLVPLGRTVGLPFNGATSNVALGPQAVDVARRELRAGGFDVVHLHEPVAPAVCWDALGSVAAPLVGTFHTYSDNELTHGLARLAGARRRMRHLAERVAVSDAAAWTARRFWGGDYRVIPNGVTVEPLMGRRRRAADGPLRVAFVGQAVPRKGLAVLLRAFEGLRTQTAAELTLVGPRMADVSAVLRDPRGVEALGQVDDARKRQVLRDANVVCAPSLGGESFGMVLIEAFAAGAPVVASDIVGYRDVVRAGVDGLLVPPGDMAGLTDALVGLARDPARLERLREQAATSADRFAWGDVAAQVRETYEAAMAARGACASNGGRARARSGRLATFGPPCVGSAS